MAPASPQVRDQRERRREGGRKEEFTRVCQSETFLPAAAPTDALI